MFQVREDLFLFAGISVAGWTGTSRRSSFYACAKLSNRTSAKGIFNHFLAFVPRLKGDGFIRITAINEAAKIYWCSLVFPKRPVYDPTREFAPSAPQLPTTSPLFLLVTATSLQVALNLVKRSLFLV